MEKELSYGEILHRCIMFMANHWDHDTAIAIFGENLGEHFWSKWVGTNERTGNPDYATMRLFYEMSDHYLDDLAMWCVNYYGK